MKKEILRVLKNFYTKLTIEEKLVVLFPIGLFLVIILSLVMGKRV